MGRIIYQSILEALRGGATSGLPHPLLNCGLCSNAGVVWSPDEIFEQLKSVLDSTTVDRFKEWDNAAAHLRGVRYILDCADATAVEEIKRIASQPGGARPSHVGRRAGRGSGSGSASPVCASLDLLFTEVRVLRGVTDNPRQGSK